MYRNLTADEVSALTAAGCMAEDWNQVFVADPFVPSRVRDCAFSGTVYLGAMDEGFATHGDLRLPHGLFHAALDNCTVGARVALHNVRMLSRYRVGDDCLLFNVDEMTCGTDYAWLEPMNECGGRRILPFGGMRVGDAYLWARYRDRQRLMEALERMTLQALQQPQCAYGHIGDACVIKNSKELHNVFVASSAEAPTHISGCVILADGVVGYGCTLEDGCMARRFLLGENVHLEFGVRLNDTVVGDNSTIARCEVGCSIIFPAHEQHHNNSFLIAALVMGQSNLAAGSTIGSNHNGRTADNEIAAGRGFWPGLCCSLKHSSRFASYCLLAKGAYPAELDISLPFALVSNNETKGQLEVMPAYWWMYNMYALNRNEKKFAKRDKRVYKSQHIEFTPLAPDTAEEIVCGRELLRHWTEQAYLASQGSDGKIVVTAPGMEKGKRRVVITKAAQGYAAYEEMLVYYAMQTLLADRAEGDRTMPDAARYEGPREVCWENIGGQLIARGDLEHMMADIEEGRLSSWEQVHERFDTLWQQYPDQKRRHAYQLLCMLAGVKSLGDEQWGRYLTRYDELCHYVADQVRVTREKDEQNPFRRMTYRNDAEMQAVLG